MGPRPIRHSQMPSAAGSTIRFSDQCRCAASWTGFTPASFPTVKMTCGFRLGLPSTSKLVGARNELSFASGSDLDGSLRLICSLRLLRAFFQNCGHFKQGPVAVLISLQTKFVEGSGREQALNRRCNF